MFIMSKKKVAKAYRTTTLLYDAGQVERRRTKEGKKEKDVGKMTGSRAHTKTIGNVGKI